MTVLGFVLVVRSACKLDLGIVLLAIRGRIIDERHGQGIPFLEGGSRWEDCSGKIMYVLSMVNVSAQGNDERWTACSWSLLPFYSLDRVRQGRKQVYKRPARERHHYYITPSLPAPYLEVSRDFLNTTKHPTKAHPRLPLPPCHQLKHRRPRSMDATLEDKDWVC
jgi:hypothetical protein